MKKKFIEHLKKANQFNDKEYLYYTITYNAAPTLALEKPSSLLIFKNSTRNLKNCWITSRSEIKNRLNIDYYELNHTDNLNVVLFYNKNMLETIVREKRNMTFLKRFGYKEDMTLEQCLGHLSSRYNRVCPHEIGIFLGYPLYDVAVFANCPDKKCLGVGYWKVYSKMDEAQETFNRFNLTKDNTVDLILAGVQPQEIIDKRMLVTA